MLNVIKNRRKRFCQIDPSWRQFKIIILKMVVKSWNWQNMFRDWLTQVKTTGLGRVLLLAFFGIQVLCEKEEKESDRIRRKKMVQPVYAAWYITLEIKIYVALEKNIFLFLTYVYAWLCVSKNLILCKFIVRRILDNL